MIEIKLSIEPLPQPRARITRNGAYQPAKIVKYKKEIRQAGIEAMNGAAPLKDELACTMRLYRKYSPTSRRFGDLDNLYKAATDALNGVVYGDDSQLVQCNVEKFTDNQPCALIGLKDRFFSKKANKS